MCQHTSVAKTASFTKGNKLSIPVNLGAGDSIATNATVTYCATETGTYRSIPSMFYYENGNIVVSADACASAVAGTVVYLKVVFDDSNATTTTIALTVND